MQVDIVQRRLDLIHHIERRRPTTEHSEEVRQSGQRALTAGQQRQLLDILAAWLGFHLDASVQQVIRISQHQSPGTAGEQQSEQTGEIGADVGKGRSKHRLNLEINRFDHFGEFTTGVTHVFKLFLEELVTLL